MPNKDIIDVEEALTKSGPELFKELFRVYPVADPEDYFKNGAWRNDVMKADLRLMEAHKRECGAPDPPALDDVKLPSPLPSANATAFSPLATTWGQTGQTLTPATLSAGQAAVQAGMTSGVQGASVVEIRLIALFVAKWKLDPASAKAVLAKLTPGHRRFVIQNFKATATGPEGAKELEAYVAACEADKSWDVESAKSGVSEKVGSAVGGPKLLAPKLTGVGAVAAGLKRPLTPTVSAAEVSAKKVA